MRLDIEFKDLASAEVRRVIRAARPEAVIKVGARGVTNRLRSHFDFLQATRPNQLRGKRTNFWRGCRDATHIASVTATKATIAISQIGFAQRLLGGKIRPGRSINPKTGRPTRFIAFPVKADAYGTRPAERNDLEFAFVPGFGPALVEARATEIRITKGKNGRRTITPVKTRTGLVPLYRLTDEVDQKADASLIPTREQMAAAGAEAVAEYANALREVKP